MGGRHFMNPAIGRHLGAGAAAVKPEPEAPKPEEAPSTLICPKCGAELSVEPKLEAEEEHGEGEAVPV